MTRESQAQRFARIVLDAFKDAELYTDKQVKDAGGPSNTNMTNYRKARAGKLMRDGRPLPEPRGDALDAIDTAAGWERGSARRVWLGGEPRKKAPRTELDEVIAKVRALGLPADREAVIMEEIRVAWSDVSDRRHA